MAMVVRSYGLTAAEAVLGATRHAADALDHEGGWLVEGGPPIWCCGICRTSTT